MEQQVAVTQEKNSLFKHTLMNPMVRKLDRITEQDSEHSATYSGIVAKTFFFLLLTGVGAALYFVVHQIFIADAVIEITDYSISLQESGVLLLALLFTALGPVLIWLIRPLIPVTGGLYCLGQGYVVAAMCCISGSEYSGYAWLSFILTVVIVAVMLLLYVKKVIQVTAKFRSVVTTLFVTSVVFSLGMLLCALIPPLKPLYDFFTQNMIVNIVSGVVFVILAALFLLVDFDCIRHTVEDKLPRKYEWVAAMALVFTVIWLYFKILNLLLKLTGGNQKQ